MAKDKSKNKDKNSKPANDDDEFGDPGERSSFKLADHEGALLLITPRSLEEGIETAYGESDAIKADIVVLTKTNGKALDEPEVHEGALIFQRVVIGQLESAIGKRMVLGKVGRGVAKKGQSAPFLIEKADDDDKALAREYRKSVDPLA